MADYPRPVTYGGVVDWSGPSTTVKRDFVHADGSFYERVPPEEFRSFDDVDSRTIVDDGEPT